MSVPFSVNKFPPFAFISSITSKLITKTSFMSRIKISNFCIWVNLTDQGAHSFPSAAHQTVLQSTTFTFHFRSFLLVDKQRSCSQGRFRLAVII